MQGKMWEHSVWSCHFQLLALWLPSEVLQIAWLTWHQGSAVLTCVPGSLCTARGWWRGTALTGWTVSGPNETAPIGQRDCCLNLPSATQQCAGSELTGSDADTHPGKMNPEHHRQHRERQEARKGKVLRQSLTALYTVWGAVLDQPKGNTHHQILKSPESEHPLLLLENECW